LHGAVSRRGQFFYMFMVTAIGGIFTLIVNGARHDIPPEYWYLTLGIVFVTGICSFDLFADIGRQLGSVEPKIDVSEKWAARRETYGHLLVQAGVVTSMVSFYIVVDRTGGLLSPYTPLLAAPPIFGAFVAQTVRGVLALVVLAVAAIMIMDRALFPGVKEAPWYAYCLPQVAVLASAGLISAITLWWNNAKRGRSGDGA
jgi:hypothetical protein